MEAGPPDADVGPAADPPPPTPTFHPGHRATQERLHVGGGGQAGISAACTRPTVFPKGTGLLGPRGAGDHDGIHAPTARSPARDHQVGGSPGHLAAPSFR